MPSSPQRTVLLTTFLFVLAPGGGLPVHAQEEAPIVEERRVYAVAPTRDGEIELAVDLYRPSDRAPEGAVVLIHGGSFVTGGLDIEENRDYGRALARRGYLAAAIQYRLDGDRPRVEGWAQSYADAVSRSADPRLRGAIEQFGQDFPEAVAAAGEDLIRAVRWLRSHAHELGFAPERVALFGASAGAITALTTAYAMELHGAEEVEVAGVVDLRGFLLRNEGQPNPFDEDGPPLLLLHGGADQRVPLPDAEEVYRLARDAGTPVSLYVSEPHGHELGGSGLLALRVEGGRTVLDLVDRFLAAAFDGRPLPDARTRGRLLPGDAGFRHELGEAVEALLASVREGSGFVDSLYGISRPGLLERPFLDPDRRDWSYWPRARGGLPIRHMTADQRTATQRVLATLLSSKGYLKVNHVMLLEEILTRTETAGFSRGVEGYTVTVFGQPSDPPWALRFEGHHVSLNVTLPPEGGVSVTPSFLGSAPAPVPTGIRAGFHPLRYEQRHALELLASLDEEQRAAAVLSDTPPGEIVSTQFLRDPAEWDGWWKRLDRDGVRASTFDGPQRRRLEGLLREIVETYPDEIADPWFGRLDLDELWFAWMGEPAMGRPHYFRIQGERFVFELDASQGDGSHVHTVWRDREGDLGDDLLRSHYGSGGHRH